MGAALHGGKTFVARVSCSTLLLHKPGFSSKKGIMGGFQRNLSFLEPFPQTPWRTTDDFKEQLQRLPGTVLFRVFVPPHCLSDFAYNSVKHKRTPFDAGIFDQMDQSGVLLPTGFGVRSPKIRTICPFTGEKILLGQTFKAL